jgi:PTS system nitrogen regulatory IIA component
LNNLVSHLSVTDIQLGVDVAGKRALFDAIGRHIEQTHGLAHERVVAALLRREQAGSTGVGRVAIPHARIDNIERILACYFRLRSPIEFGAPDKKPVSHALILFVPTPATDEHLQILAETTHLFSDAAFRRQLNAGRSSRDVLQLFTRWHRVSDANG